eukprot:6452542-Prorocentrum_lima.AAC.1
MLWPPTLNHLEVGARHPTAMAGNICPATLVCHARGSGSHHLGYPTVAQLLTSATQLHIQFCNIAAFPHPVSYYAPPIT